MSTFADRSDGELIARLLPPTPSRYHRLNPLTKLTAAGVGIAGAAVAGGYPVLLLVAGTAIALAIGAGVSRRLVQVSLLVSLPLAISVVLVSVFTRAGTTPLFAIGPFTATLEGVDFAGRTLARLVAIAGSIGLFTLTTDPRALVNDLERRGVSPRLTFVALSTLDAIPRLLERAGEVTEAARARGLDTEGSPLRRIRGVLQLLRPTILGALEEVEERSLALETRGFARPGRRHPLWAMGDSPAQRLARLALVAALVAVVAARLAGIG